MCLGSTSECACEVLAARPEGLPPEGLSEGLRRVRRLIAQAEAHHAAYVAEAERTGAAHREGFPSTCAWLAALSGEPVSACRAQVAVAEALQQMPGTREAFAAGVVSESRVRLLAQAQALAPEQFAQDETQLVARLAEASSGQAPQVLAAWKRTADPAGAEGEAERLHSLRALHISPAWTGMVHLSGDLDPESGLVVLTALRSLTDPPNLDPDDHRTPAQCRADALVEICQRYLQGGDGSGSSRPQVTVTVPWDSLQQGAGVVGTEAGPVGGRTARRVTCDASVSRMILDPEGMPLDVGRSRRLIPPALRRALEERDRQCTHLGCDVPARWCDAHHIQHWADGGQTVLANLRLLCRRHHRAAHQNQPYPQRE